MYQTVEDVRKPWLKAWSVHTNDQFKQGKVWFKTDVFDPPARGAAHLGHEHRQCYGHIFTVTLSDQVYMFYRIVQNMIAVDSVETQGPDPRTFCVVEDADCFQRLPEDAKTSASEQGDDLLMFYFAFEGELSPYGMTLAAYAGRIDYAKKLWCEALQKALETHQTRLGERVDETGFHGDAAFKMLHNELASFPCFQKWWTVATSMLRPFMLHFNFKDAE